MDKRTVLVCAGWLVATAVVLLASGSVRAADDAAAQPVLDTFSFWRTHYTMMQPVYLKDGKLEKMPTGTRGSVGKWTEYPTAEPAADWMQPDFDDSGWLRMAGLMVAGTEKGTDSKSPFTALECLRGKFQVKDPAAATGLTLSLEYRGGVVVYVNGKEIARAHLAADAKPDTLADSTQPGETLPRKLTADIPATALRKGTNVLAIESHRAAYLAEEIVINTTKWPQGITFERASCGVDSIQLSAPQAAVKALAPNVLRPAGFQVWNSNPLATDFDMDYGDPNEPLKPIVLVGTRNGTFSGKVVAGSNEPIKGIKGTVTELVSADGKSRIAASRIQVRYAIPDGVEAYAEARYMGGLAEPLRPNPEDPRAYARARVPPPLAFGDLLPTAPAAISVYTKVRQPGGRNETQPTSIPTVFGAVVPVWVTVNVPADAATGDYNGTLTITAQGQRPVAVPVELSVSAWRLPDPQKFTSFIEVAESPESLALAYDVPLWSDRHFALLETVFVQLGKLGNKVVYIPLICQTNLGNAQSMVRWVKQPDGSYKPDFSILDRYLDIVQKHQGKPAVMCFYLWDSFLDRTLGGRGDEKYEPEGTKAEVNAQKGRGPDMTTFDPTTGEIGTREMPAYADEKCPEVWAAVSQGIMERMKARGWTDSMMLGLLCDYQPTKESALGIAKIFPDVPWASVAHWWPREFYGIPVTYKANVFVNYDYLQDPSEKRFYGWNKPELACHFPRLLRDYFPLTTFRLAEEMSFLRNYRGLVRMGADFWPVLKNRRGERLGTLAGRFPKSFWNNLNMEVSLLAQGPEGAVANARFEAIREGLQECEARIVIERALIDPKLRAKLGDALAEKCQKLLDDRTREIRRGVSTFVQSGSYVQWAMGSDNWWQRPGVVGHQYYVGSGWQQRSEQLYSAAADVAKRIEE